MSYEDIRRQLLAGVGDKEENDEDERMRYAAQKQQQKNVKSLVQSVAGAVAPTVKNALFNQYDPTALLNGQRAPANADEERYVAMMTGASGAFQGAQHAMNPLSTYDFRKMRQESAGQELKSSWWDMLGQASMASQAAQNGQQLTPEQVQALMNAGVRLNTAMQQSREANKVIDWEGRDELLREYRRLDKIDNPQARQQAQAVREQLRQGDEAAGNIAKGGDMSYTLGETAIHTGKAFGEDLAYAFYNAALTAVDSDAATPSAFGDMIGRATGAGTISEYKRNNQEYRDFMDARFAEADALRDKARQELQMATENHHPVYKAGVDIGKNLMEMGTDVFLAKLTGGSSLVPMAIRVFGQSAGEARERGYDINQQAAYGAASAAIEVFTEMIGGFGGRAQGQGWSDEFADKLVNELAQSEAGRRMLHYLIGAIEEGGEEVLSDLLQPAAEYVAGMDITGYDISEMLYDFFIGAAVGGTSSVTGMATTGWQAATRFQGDTQSLIDMAQAAGEGTRSRELAGQLQQRLTNKGSISQLQAEDLSQQAQRDIQAEDRPRIEAAVREQLQKRSEKPMSQRELDKAVRNIVDEAFEGDGNTYLKSDLEREVYKDLQAQFRGGGTERWLNTADLAASRVNDAEMARLRNVETKDGQQVRITGADMVDGELQLRYEQDGKTVTAKQSEMKLNDAQKDTLRQLVEILGEDAAAAYNGMGEGIQYGAPSDLLDYATSFAVVRDLFGAKGASLEKALSSNLRNRLSDTQVMQAMKVGQMQAQKSGSAQQQTGKVTQGSGQVSPDGGTITLEGGKNVQLKAVKDKAKVQRSRQYAAVKAVARALGIDVVLFESEANSKGELTEANGAYQNGVIYLDWNAGMNNIKETSKRMLLRTMSHELTHDLQRSSPAEYEKLKQRTIEYLAEKMGEDYVDLVKGKMANQKGLSYEGALDEVVADACETMLADSEYVQQMIREDRSFGQKIWDWIKKFFTKIEAQDEGAKILRENIDEFRTLWDNAMRATVEARRGQSQERAAEGVGPYTETAARAEARSGAEESAMSAQLSAMEERAVEQLQPSSQKMVEALGKGSSIEINRKGEMEIAKSADGHTLLFSPRTYEDGGKDKLIQALKENGHTQEEIDAVIENIEATGDFLEKLADQYADSHGYQNLKKNLYATISTSVKSGKQVISTLVNNGDYPINLDLQLICKKRVAYMRMLTRLIDDGVFEKVDFKSGAIADLNKILRDGGFETACLGCFVESRRLQLQAWAETIVSEWNAAVDEINPAVGDFNFAKGGNELSQMEIAGLITELENAGKKNDKGNLNLGRGAVAEKMKRLLKKVPSLAQHLTVADLLTPQGMSMLRQYDSNLFSLVKQRYGAASPKIVQDFNPYNSEIADLSFKFVKDMIGESVTGSQAYKSRARKALKKKEGESKASFDRRVEDEALRRYLYDIGGVRIQSFSDFMIENVFDYMQIIADLSAREMPLHGYSKEAVFLRLFGMTGGKFNGSLIAHVEKSMGKEYAGLLPVEEASNGRGIVVEVDGEKYAICFDDYARHAATGSFIQSIGMKDIVALQLDPRYSKNVGSITIGVSNKQIRAMLDSPYFRMVIPYHASGMIKEFAELVGVSSYNDYTKFQTTRVNSVHMVGNSGEVTIEFNEKTGKQKVLNAAEKELKVDTHFDFNEALQRLGDARAAANEYLEWCRDDRKHPVYDDKKIIGYASFTPKFSDVKFKDQPMVDFTQHPNYYKLLEDFNVYDSLGEAPAQQGAVTMTLPSEATRLTPEQMDAYKQALRDTGLYTEKEIQKYAKKADMTFQEMIAEEVGNRAEYESRQAKVWDETVGKAEQMLLEKYSREEGSKNAASEGGRVQLSARGSWNSLSQEEKDQAVEENRAFNESQTKTGSNLVTLKGSDISRGGTLAGIRYSVGKVIGGRLYIHKSYADTIGEIDPKFRETLVNAEEALHEEYPDFQYNCINYHPASGEIQFQEAPDFDTAREPVVGKQINVQADGTVTEANRGKPFQQIWHHKWQWVGNDYKGFNVRQSWEWSKEWLSTILGASKGGSMRAWNEQLAENGLPEDGGTAQFSARPVSQQFSSEDTSINQNKLPGVFTKGWFTKELKDGGVNIDIGGGKYDNAAEYLKQYGVTNMVFDPFNRNRDHNKGVLDYVMSGKRADTVTCANVLNVIQEPAARENVILECAKAMKPDGKAFFLIYEGDKTGNGRTTKTPVRDQNGVIQHDENGKTLYSTSWQEHRDAKSYLEEIKQYFDVAVPHGNLIVAEKPKADLPQAAWQLDKEGETVQFSIRPEAKKEIHDVLGGKEMRGNVVLTDGTPSIMLGHNGVKNLPLAMAPSHARENILSEEEAKAKGFPTGENYHYHGLGEPLFYQIIDGLNDVTEAYRGTKNATNPARRENYFLLVSKYKDASQNFVNVPVYINTKSQYNQMFIDTNTVATVFGKDNFRDYISRQLRNGDLVRIKRKGTTASERPGLIPDGYSGDTSEENVPHSSENSNTPGQLSVRSNNKTDRELLNDLYERVQKREREIAERNEKGLKAGYQKMLSDKQDVIEEQREALERYHKLIGRYRNAEEAVNRELNTLDELINRNGSRAQIAQQRQILSAAEGRLSTAARALSQGENSDEIQSLLRRERQLQREQTSQKIRESVNSREMKRRVAKRAAELYEMLTTNSDKVHVPEVLKEPLGEFLQTLDFTSRRALAGGEETKADQKFGARLQQIRDILENQQRYLSGDETAMQDLGGYLDISEESMEFLRGCSELITYAMSENRGFTINEMNAEQLRDLANFLSNLRTAIRRMNTFLANERFASVREAASADITELQRLGRAKNMAENRILNEYLWKNGTPYYIFKRFGAGGESIFQGFAKGWSQMAFDAREIMEFTKKAYTDKEVKQWRKEKHDFTLEDGSKITMTTAQIMELSQLLGRQQAVQHLQHGGMRIGNIETKTGAKGDTRHHHLSEGDIQQILGALSERQAEVARELQHFMAERGADWGNEVSMKRFGYRFYVEGEGYYPIKTDSNDRPMADTDAQRNSMFRLLNLSSSKSLNPKATNALVVGDIFDTFTDHMADMAKLHGMGLPILDAIKWFNFKERIDRDDGGYDTRTLQGALEEAFGSAAGSYFRTLMKDINGQTENGDRGTGLASLAIGAYKAQAVAANLRVALLQPTAYLRAATVLKPRYMVAAFGNFRASVFAVRAAEAAWKEAMQHSGEMVWKDIGGYDTDLSRSMRSQIQHSEGVHDKIVTGSMVLAEWGDKLTWGRLWAACKLQARAENPGVSGQALMDATEKLFREVIYSSQVMDSTLTRSELMRGKTNTSKLLTAFMAEPTLSVNILMDTASQYDLDKRRSGRAEAWKKNKGKIFKAFSLWVCTQTAAALVESLADALRDDDDEEYWKKLLEALFGEDNAKRMLGEELDKNAKGWLASAYSGNLMQDYLLPNKLPVLKEVTSLLSGFKSRNMLTEGAENLLNVYKIWRETKQLEDGILDRPTSVTYYGKMTPWGKVYKTLQAISQLSGTPLYNASRDGIAIWNTIMNGWKDDWKVLTYDNRKSTDKLTAAVRGGKDTEEIRAKLLEDGVTEKEMNSAVRTEIRAMYNGTQKTPGISEEEAVRLLVSEGGMRQKDAESQVQEWKYEKLNEAKYDDMREGYIKGEISREQAIEDRMTYGGQSRKNAEQTVREWDCEKDTGIKYDEMDEAYVDGQLTRQQAIDMRMKYGGVSQTDAEALVRQWDCEKDTGIVYNDMKDAYLYGEINKRQALDMRVKYGGVSDDAAETTLMKWDCEKDTGIPYDEIRERFVEGSLPEKKAISLMVKYGGKDEIAAQKTMYRYRFVGTDKNLEDITDSQATHYYAEFYETGMSKKTYYTAVNQMSSFKADVDANGKTINGSKKTKVLAYIDSLPITDHQKDLFYLMMDYSEGELRKAPWHK